MSSIFNSFIQGSQAGQKASDNKYAQEQRVLAQEQQAKDLRKKANFEDARIGRQLLESKNFQGFLDLASNRIEAIEATPGGDSSDTRYLLDMFNAGDIDGLIGALKGAEEEGITTTDSQGNAFLSDPLGRKIKQAQLDRLTGKGGTKEKKEFEKQAQFEQLQELKKNGTPEQVAEFRTLIGLDKPVKLSSVAETALNKAQESSFSAGNAVRKMELLAQDINKTNIGGGLTAGFSETLKNLLGGQDEVSNLRREFRSIRSSQAVRNLPPGVASDKDIALALSGFPREDAPASEIISFLNGQAKLAKMEVAFNDFKGDYISTKKGISGFGKAWREQLKDDDFVSSILTIDSAANPVEPQPSNNQDSQALQWAQANPNDPRSTAILKKLGKL